MNIAVRMSHLGNGVWRFAWFTGHSRTLTDEEVEPDIKSARIAARKVQRQSEKLNLFSVLIGIHTEQRPQFEYIPHSVRQGVLARIKTL